ncbi:uncharacterized protein LOC128884126 [Hylaeus volcanicus]|uniref:uncharacterized protein LOC128884126 n=1 Tax=Hylaeus volcanicus TaxID=313075 RepID=UPI0023B7C68A|nr:uncharacterized protein LOC128884126 [Hylaeus volcanicus]
MARDETVQSLILKAGHQLGRSSGDIEPYIRKIVDENWIDSLEALKSTPPVKLIEIGIPLRLIDEVFRQIDLIENSIHKGDVKKLKTDDTDTLINDSQLKVSCDNDVLERKQEEKNFYSITYETPTHLPVLNEFASYFDQLKQECFGNCENYVKALKTFLKIVDNVLKFPNDVTKRRLKTSNNSFQSSIGRFSITNNILQGLGFCLNSSGVWELLTLYLVRLTDGYQIIASFLFDMNIKAPPVPASQEFNPFKSSIGTTDQNNSLFKPGPLRDMFETRKKNISLSKTDPCETVNNSEVLENPYIFDANIISKNVSNKGSEFLTEDDLSDINPDEYITASIIQQIKNNSLGRRSFKARADVVSQNSILQSSSTHCTLKFYFPNHMILQLDFSPNATLEHVYHSFKKYLKKDIRNSNWYLYESPPRCVIPCNSETLIARRFLPSAKLFFGFNQIPVHLQSQMTYLAPEYLATQKKR